MREVLDLCGHPENAKRGFFRVLLHANNDAGEGLEKAYPNLTEHDGVFVDVPEGWYMMLTSVLGPAVGTKVTVVRTDGDVHNCDDPMVVAVGPCIVNLERLHVLVRLWEYVSYGGYEEGDAGAILEASEELGAAWAADGKGLQGPHPFFKEFLARGVPGTERGGPTAERVRRECGA